MLLHGADFHIGSYQYGSHEREADYVRALIRACRADFSAGLGEPFTPSELSGQPGYLFDDLDGFDRPRPDLKLRLRLTADEIRRLILHSLRPSEYLKLRASHGMFFLIHDDFFNDDGLAIQPKMAIPPEDETSATRPSPKFPKRRGKTKRAPRS
jgi:hypothetical protein